MKTTTPLLTGLTPIVLAATLLLGACSSTDDPAARSQDATSTTAAATTSETAQESTADSDRDELQNELDAVIANISDGYRAAESVWNGFVPNDHPTVLPFRTASGEVRTVLAINHPDPDAIGAAVELPTDGLPFRSLHRIDTPTDLEPYQTLAGFDFHFKAGGVDSFAMIAGGGDEFFDPMTLDYNATLLHEMFHRYQDQAFSGDLGTQDVEGYAYTKDNLALAVLEDRALTEALNADSDDERRVAAERFSALRLVRRAADPRVVLDDNQEMFEGTARFVEAKMAGQNTGYRYHENNFDRDLLTKFMDEGVKEGFGFGRFYASGAAMLRVAELMGVTDIDKRVEDGESPASILIDATGVDPSSAGQLVEDARANYDPVGALDDEAADAALRAQDEGSVFGDDPNSEGGDGGAEGFEISEEEEACLSENGFDFDNPNEPITDEMFEACLN